jgi:assimilatory nitrate reductase catalytic subunit
MADTRSTCPYCGVGCGVIIESEGARITGVRGDPDHPANFGRLCTKGSTLHRTATAAVTLQTRLLQPLQRTARGAAPVPIDWDGALDRVAAAFARTVRAHGPDSVGFYLSGQLLTEDYYVFNKLAKGLVGTNNLDTNSRLCMSSAVAGYKATLGADAPPVCYDDVNHADCLFIAGSNTAWAHPVFFRRIEDAKRADLAMKIVVCDPRRTDTASVADLHLPLQPGTDVMLYHAMLHVMLARGWTRPDWIAAHTTGFDALAARVRDCTPERAAEICGLPAEDIVEAARLFATSAATLSLYCMGLNQSSSGTDKNAALIGLHLATAQIGRPGAGPFSLTGQPNAMGGREVGGMANLLSAHRDLGNAAHRAEIAALWGVPDVPATPGKTAVEMFQAAADGEIKALWIGCTNPAQSMPDQATVRRALERAEFVVVQEAFATTATAAFADLLLPATTWGEKIGTVTNSERRISRVRAAVPPAGEARHDWQIAAEVARRMAPLLDRPAAMFGYDTPEAVWNEHRESTRGRDLDITGLSWPLLDALGPQQWPVPIGAPAGTARLYQDGAFATPDGRARFSDAPWQPLAEPRDAEHPLSLTTGRLRDQWHGMSRTGTVGSLFGHAPEPAVQLHPADMARHGLQDGDIVALRSRRGQLLLPAQASEDLGRDQAFVAMHWGPEFLMGNPDADAGARGIPGGGVNALTVPAFCPTSKQPELKHAAVRLEKADLPWSLVALAWLPEDRALAARQALAPLLARLPYASCVPFGAPASPADRDGASGVGRTGVLLRGAAAEAPGAPWLDAVAALLQLDAPDTQRYADPRAGQFRRARLDADAGPEGDTRLDAFLLAGDTRSAGWMRTLLQERLPAQAYGRRLLMASSAPPVAQQSQGRSVCNCLGVTERAIELQLARCTGDDAHRLAQLQDALQCGTRCGSCVPELRRMVRASPATPVPAPEAASLA